MKTLLQHLIQHAAEHAPDTEALKFKGTSLPFAGLYAEVKKLASGFVKAGLARGDRVGVYLPKQLETVYTLFAAPLAGGIAVPINPNLKTKQVEHILRDCDVKILVTSAQRASMLSETLASCSALTTTVLVDNHATVLSTLSASIASVPFADLLEETPRTPHRVIDTDPATIIYTSGSTGKPKGVVFSHRNLVAGAASVAEYLRTTSSDRILCALPFSFDYGLSQLTIAFHSQATAVLMDYLLPRDVIAKVKVENITGLAGVPSMWIQLAEAPWPSDIATHLRYITNSGGALPQHALNKLRQQLPTTQVYLMYGFTEAFRSTYLPPEELEQRPGSMGKAIPNAEVFVLREDGSLCDPEEPGELVHRGSLVSLGYWNDPHRSAEKFRPLPESINRNLSPEIAAWSGDTVRMDKDGYLTFIGRSDNMIKTSGYRVSPTDVEDALYESGHIAEAIAIGVPHPRLGQAIVVIAIPNNETNSDALLALCTQQLPNYMVPARIELRDTLPRNPNGKPDRQQLVTDYHDIFAKPET